MPLKFNFGDQSIPRVLSRIYNYAPLERHYTLLVNGRAKITIEVEKAVNAAWKYIENNCAKSPKCNDYFKSLPQKKSLDELMTGTTFIAHLLKPKDKYTEEDLPSANGAGQDIGFSMYVFADTYGNDAALAAVLLHEIAHCGGASTDPEGKTALEAENSLVHCGLKHYYSDKAKG